MIDVRLPAADGREIVLTRATEPEPELRLLLDRMNPAPPAQPPKKDRRRGAAGKFLSAVKTFGVKTFSANTLIPLRRDPNFRPNPNSRGGVLRGEGLDEGLRLADQGL